MTPEKRERLLSLAMHLTAVSTGTCTVLALVQGEHLLGMLLCLNTLLITVLWGMR